MISTMETPNRASDAGPITDDRPLTWRDHLASAAEEIQDAGRLYRDNAVEERRLRILAINDAIEFLRQARDAVPSVGEQLRINGVGVDPDNTEVQR